jgi:LmbE family N-acetylglucosaminyl deacetylase
VWTYSGHTDIIKAVEKGKLITIPKRVLAIGAHPDDVEVSCSGFLLKLKREYNCQLFSLICTGGRIEIGTSDKNC